MTSSDLGQGESLRLNLAYPLEATKIVIHISILSQDVVPMVKVVLLESYPLVTSGKGLVHVWSRYYDVIDNKLGWLSIDYMLRQVHRTDLKMESGTPTGAIAKVKELGDCLSDGFKPTYGNGAFIVKRKMKEGRKYLFNSISQRIGFRCYSTTRDLPKRFEKLINICSTPKNDFKVNDIYKLMYNVRMYEIAYDKLKSNPGNMTSGINPITLDGISITWIQETIEQMKNNSFQFKPGRRIQIPKPGKIGTRPLTIAPPRDKIVQEVIRMILEQIFEPTFSSNSHGFRPNKGCHTALRQIKTQFGATSFLIEGDIAKCFESFDHKLLINLLEKKISDQRFLQLIWKALRAGYLEFHTVQDSIIGTPQGSIISPILSNIYLHELDKYINELKINYDKGTVVSRNPAYRKLENLRYKAIKVKDNISANKFLKKMQTMNSRLPNDPKFRRLYYVRYADDWIVSIRGPRTDATQILENIKDKLEADLKLNLSVEKSKITNPRKETALFLGTYIKFSHHIYHMKGKHHQTIRVPGQLRLIAPLDKIYKKLTNTGFMHAKYKTGTPKFLWYHNSKDTILTLYNSVLRGYLNYYSFTHNYSRVASSLEFILKTSCAKLLAAKFKLRSVLKVINKYGPDLKGNDKIKWFKPSYKLNTWDFKSNSKDRIKTLYASFISAASLDNLICTKCGSNERVEMHHVRLIKDINPKLSEINKIMVKRQRKQIPLCRSCHLDHHQNHKPWGKTKRNYK